MLNHEEFNQQTFETMNAAGAGVARFVAQEYYIKNRPEKPKPLTMLEVGFGGIPSISFKETLEDILEYPVAFTGIDTRPPNSNDDIADKGQEETPMRGKVTYKMGQYGNVFDEKNNDISQFDVIIARNIDPSIIQRLAQKLLSFAQDGAVIVMTTASRNESEDLESALESGRIEKRHSLTPSYTTFPHSQFKNYTPDHTIFIIKIKGK